MVPCWCRAARAVAEVWSGDISIFGLQETRWERSMSWLIMITYIRRFKKLYGQVAVAPTWPSHTTSLSQKVLIHTHQQSPMQQTCLHNPSTSIKKSDLWPWFLGGSRYSSLTCPWCPNHLYKSFHALIVLSSCRGWEALGTRDPSARQWT